MSTTHNTATVEQLTQALHSATFAADHLRRALSSSDAIACIILMPLIGEQVLIERRIAALIAALGPAP